MYSLLCIGTYFVKKCRVTLVSIISHLRFKELTNIPVGVKKQIYFTKIGQKCVQLKLFLIAMPTTTIFIQENIKASIAGKKGVKYGT